MTNIVLLVGNLGSVPELRSTNGGTDVASFSIGTSRVKRDSEGKTYKDESGFTAKDTEWHRITCFNGLGRIVASHATKGMLVSVKGRIHNSKWTDKDGVDRYGYEIIADDVLLQRAKDFISEGLRSGQLKPVVSKVFKLDDIQEAHRYLESNEQIGKIVVNV